MNNTLTIKPISRSTESTIDQIVKTYNWNPILDQTAICPLHPEQWKRWCITRVDRKCAIVLAGLDTKNCGQPQQNRWKVAQINHETTLVLAAFQSINLLLLFRVQNDMSPKLCHFSRPPSTKSQQVHLEDLLLCVICHAPTSLGIGQENCVPFRLDQQHPPESQLAFPVPRVSSFHSKEAPEDYFQSG